MHISSVVAGGYLESVADPAPLRDVSEVDAVPRDDSEGGSFVLIMKIVGFVDPASFVSASSIRVRNCCTLPFCLQSFVECPGFLQISQFCLRVGH